VRVCARAPDARLGGFAMFIAAFARFARRYAAETRGAFAIMFALLAPVLIGCLGLAIDMTLAVLEKQRLQAALDSGAVAAAVSGETDADILEGIIEDYVKATTGHDVDGKVTVTPVGQELDISLGLEGVVRLTFLAAAAEALGWGELEGFDSIDITVDTGIYNPLEGVEVVVATDLSGSMHVDLPTLQEATITIIDRMEGLKAAYPRMSVRVGLVPWNHQVRLAPWIWGQDMDGDPYPAEDPQVIADPDDLVLEYEFAEPSTVPGAQEAVEAGYDAIWAFTFDVLYSRELEAYDWDQWDNYEQLLNDYVTPNVIHYVPPSVATWSLEKRREQCVMSKYAILVCVIPERHAALPRGARTIYEFSPSRLPDTRLDDLDALESNIVAYMGASYQNSGSVWPLSSDYAALRAHVDTYRGGGGTNPASGLVAAHMLLSPELPFGEGAAFDAPNVVKHIVLMTDGVGEYFDESVAICDLLKEQGVTIYTVGYRLIGGETYKGHTGLEFVEACASSPDHMYTPESGDELVEAFGAIANDIAEIRLTR
jgi:hypothetical protein